jgi:hypothetical protein
VDELTRFARRLVEQLGASGEGVHRAIPVGSLRETVIPYRKHRRALGVESVEDYETVLLRLVAGERGFLKTVPAEAAERCRSELAQATPDLAVLDEVAGATVQITSLAAAQVVDDGADGGDGRVGEVTRVEAARPVSPSVPTVRPSAPSSPPPPAPEPAMPAPKPPVSEKCQHCNHAIPGGRQVVFCPWCGQRLIPFACPRCNTELDSEWKHCITCGATVKDPFRYA